MHFCHIVFVIIVNVKDVDTTGGFLSINLVLYLLDDIVRVVGRNFRRVEDSTIIRVPIPIYLLGLLFTYTNLKFTVGDDFRSIRSVRR